MSVQGRAGVVAVPGGEVTYRVLGSGPAVVVPWCNLAWPDVPVVARLANDYRVVLASPLGYQASTRLEDGDEYGAARATDDLIAVCDALALDRFAVFGYSLSAAMAASLAGTPRVTIAVLGGFPLLGSYQRVLEGARAAAAELDDDLGFDAHAALRFYEDLARSPDGVLIREASCPVRAFLGSDDDIVRRFSNDPDLAGSLRRLGVETVVIDGADHVTALFATDMILGAFPEQPW